MCSTRMPLTARSGGTNGGGIDGGGIIEGGGIEGGGISAEGSEDGSSAARFLFVRGEAAGGAAAVGWC